jgi:predicted AlkP superfamily phosphohydrolase/phosphomutase
MMATARFPLKKKFWLKRDWKIWATCKALAGWTVNWLTGKPYGRSRQTGKLDNLFPMFNFLKKNHAPRVFVISIDGVPYSFMRAKIESGEFPNFKKFLDNGSFLRMNSVQPCISSVAWASYMTGKNPAKHNIFGFVDKKPGTHEIFVPNSANMTSDTIWEMMSRAGKKVFVMNVPVTYPPRQVNGILIGCFLCTQIEKIAYPAHVSRELKEMGYKIDADAWIARENLDKYLDECNEALNKRAQAMFHYLDIEQWYFFQCHIMETDRMNHFFWEHAEKDDPKYAKAFFDFYKRVDDILGEVDRKVGSEVELIVLSDHGFCTIKKEIYLNWYLAEAGILKFKTEPPKNLGNMHPESLAYSLIPGRIFVNLQGREPNGTVLPERYEAVREQLTSALLGFTDPDTGAPIIREVIRREEIYNGKHYEMAADLIAVPHDGYDLKGDVRKAVHGEKGALVGMHTYEDSLLFIRNREVKRNHNEFWVGDLAPTILKMMQLPIPVDMDGVALV